MARQHCADCSRPLASCYCSQVRKICNKTPVLIIQHRRETSHPFGTVRPLLRCLGNVRHVVLDDMDEFEAQDWMQEYSPVLVYPGRTGASGETCKTNSYSTQSGKLLFIFLDGTWKKTRRMLLRSTYLQSLPRYEIQALQKSRYRIRKAPASTYLSTLESVAEVLSTTEQEPGKYQPLLALMDTIIDKQIAVMEDQLIRKTL